MKNKFRKLKLNQNINKIRKCIRFQYIAYDTVFALVIVLFVQTTNIYFLKKNEKKEYEMRLNLFNSSMEKLFIKDLNKIYYLINSNHYDVSNMCKALNMLKDYKIINNLDNSLKNNSEGSSNFIALKSSDNKVWALIGKEQISRYISTIKVPYIDYSIYVNNNNLLNDIEFSKKLAVTKKRYIISGNIIDIYAYINNEVYIKEAIFFKKHIVINSIFIFLLSMLFAALLRVVTLKRLRLHLYKLIDKNRELEKKTIFYKSSEIATEISEIARKKLNNIIFTQIKKDNIIVNEDLCILFKIISEEINLLELTKLINDYFACDIFIKKLDIQCNYKVSSLDLGISKAALYQIIFSILSNRIYFLTDNNHLVCDIAIIEKQVIIKITDNGITLPKSEWSSPVLNRYKSNNPLILSWDKLTTSLEYYSFKYNYLKKGVHNEFIIKKYVKNDKVKFESSTDGKIIYIK